LWKKRKKYFIRKKISTPEVISELIVDEHGNYVIQKALHYADNDKQK